MLMMKIINQISFYTEMFAIMQLVTDVLQIGKIPKMVCIGLSLLYFLHMK